jgi:spore coat protein U-like protein
MTGFLRRLCVMLLAASLGVVVFPAAARANSCSATLSDMDFGTVSPLSSSDIYASAAGTITCNWTLLSPTPPYLLLLPNVVVCVSIGGGSTSSSTLPRMMSGGAAHLEYNLYRDASYAAASIAGGPATAATPTPLSALFSAPNLLTGGTVSRPFTIFGRISAGAALVAVPTVGNADTVYSASFAGHATISYTFYNLINPGCGAGASASFSFQTRATIVNNCNIVATPLNFGTVGQLNKAARGSSTLSVQCVQNNAYQIALNGGTVASAVNARQMKSANGARLNYRLSSTLDGVVWGDGTSGTAILSVFGIGTAVQIPVYGVVPAQATPAPGDYRDTVTATVIF